MGAGFRAARFGTRVRLLAGAGASVGEESECFGEFGCIADVEGDVGRRGSIPPLTPVRGDFREEFAAEDRRRFARQTLRLSRGRLAGRRVPIHGQPSVPCSESIRRAVAGR
jgi:hypothetical protein